MRDIICRAGAVAFTALILVAPLTRTAVAQGMAGVSGGVLVVPHGHGDNGRYAGISVRLAGNRATRTDLDLLYLSSDRSWRFYPPCATPGCTYMAVERERREMVGGGPTVVARLGESRLSILVGGELMRQESRTASESQVSWHFGVSPGLCLELLQGSRLDVELDARVHKMLTGGAFAPWLLPVGIAIRF